MGSMRWQLGDENICAIILGQLVHILACHSSHKALTWLHLSAVGDNLKSFHVELNSVERNVLVVSTLLHITGVQGAHTAAYGRSIMVSARRTRRIASSLANLVNMQK